VGTCRQQKDRQVKAPVHEDRKGKQEVRGKKLGRKKDRRIKKRNEQKPDAEEGAQIPKKRRGKAEPADQGQTIKQNLEKNASKRK